ncbi:PLP-dependent transferase [Sporormia fimetaria CBS 119925]|uniref:Molybdenum cofactor sulfurase n=1 Tax=Sporormia fimetaria CBS 119925 TaxID=1340428 RepID=A0A6A6V2K0_9PLEO|nr:PLP-dependent transferase [Sporormia fimetaria CBS 119925]
MPANSPVRSPSSLDLLIAAGISLDPPLLAEADEPMPPSSGDDLLGGSGALDDDPVALLEEVRRSAPASPNKASLSYQFDDLEKFRMQVAALRCSPDAESPYMPFTSVGETRELEGQMDGAASLKPVSSGRVGENANSVAPPTNVLAPIPDKQPTLPAPRPDLPLYRSKPDSLKPNPPSATLTSKQEIRKYVLEQEAKIAELVDFTRKEERKYKRIGAMRVAQDKKMLARRVVVTNIAASAGEEELWDVFREYDVASIIILEERHPINRTRAAYVSFHDEETALAASKLKADVFCMSVRIRTFLKSMSYMDYRSQPSVMGPATATRKWPNPTLAILERRPNGTLFHNSLHIVPGLWIAVPGTYHNTGNPTYIMEEQERKSYDRKIAELRVREYPMLSAEYFQGTTYLDHAGTALYAKSLIERFSADMMSNLFGNPHSASNSSQLTARRIEDVRMRLLGLSNADPEDFDVVFVANATAGIKLVMEAFAASETGFWYGYHRDAHTSLIGVRESAKEHRCFASDQEVEGWIDDGNQEHHAGLFAFPAQSNMNGRRLPLDWIRRIRTNKGGKVHTLLDAAALVSTSPLWLGDSASAPDFTVLSLYKIFGFPDLGALIVRKDSASVFDRRRYFGGGTVEMVVCLKEQWHAKKSDTLHERLEDGTLPIHSIMALETAMTVHQELFKSLEEISRHTTYLAARLYDDLAALRHANGSALCQIYKGASSVYGDARSQGPIVAFNMRNHLGGWISNAEVEKLTAVKNIQLRTGGLCNPGGVAFSLGLSPWEMKENFSAGQRCGNDNDIIRAKPTGMIRVSLGAMSTLTDVSTFVGFLREFFIDNSPLDRIPPVIPLVVEPPTGHWHVESLSIYPLKSCGAWSVPHGMAWEIRPEGLAWDREWCLVHQGTGAALSQKRYPKMALIRPSIDLEEGVLRIELTGSLRESTPENSITVPLSADPRMFSPDSLYKDSAAKVCGDSIRAKTYKSSRVSAFFSQALGVACHLARFPAVGAGNSSTSPRHAKAHLQKSNKENCNMHVPGAFPDAQPQALGAKPRPILLSNESPILTISRSSLNRLNEQIKIKGGKAAKAEVFRANIVVAESMAVPAGSEQPYAEDNWRYLRIGTQYFDMLGPCRRCQMICVDQKTAEKNEEPFVTLSKTRRFDGRVYFGEHTSHIPIADSANPLAQFPTIAVGDTVQPFLEDEVNQDEGLRMLVQ